MQLCEYFIGLEGRWANHVIRHIIYGKKPELVQQKQGDE